MYDGCIVNKCHYKGKCFSGATVDTSSTMNRHCSFLRFDVITKCVGLSK